jgi:hypothetical protein
MVTLPLVHSGAGFHDGSITTIGCIIATGSWVWRVLGILLGTATCISIVYGFAVEPHNLPLKIYQRYVWLRQPLFEPPNCGTLRDRGTQCTAPLIWCLFLGASGSHLLS